MKKNRFSLFAIMICITLAVFAAGAFAGCGNGGEETDPAIPSVAFTSAVISANANEAFSHTLTSTTTGATFAVASGSTLPSWLSLTGNTLSGTPTTVAAATTFDIVASATGYNATTATLTVSVLPAGEQTFTFAAAHTNLDDAVGGSQAYGGSIYGRYLIENTDATGNLSSYFLLHTHRFRPTITWAIYSPEATTANLQISLGSDLVGTFNFGAGGHTLSVNGAVVAGAAAINVTRVEDGNVMFNLTDLGSINLEAGYNFIELEHGANAWLDQVGAAGGGTGGVAIDSIVLTSSQALTWDADLSNTERF